MTTSVNSTSNLLHYPTIIIIGGSSRNVGKTTLCINLIRKYSKTTKITGLKVTSIRAGDNQVHGSHPEGLSGEYKIWEETNRNSLKDTARMLEAGAHRVFYIQAADNHLFEAFQAFLKMTDPSVAIVCESRSLRKIVKPGLFVLLKHFHEDKIKAEFAYYEELADVVSTIESDTHTSGKLTHEITWDGQTWRWANQSKLY